WPSLMRPSRRCSVPTKLWLNRSASLRASASTCWARGVKLFIASSLIVLVAQHALGGRICPVLPLCHRLGCSDGRRRWRCKIHAFFLISHCWGRSVVTLSEKCTQKFRNGPFPAGRAARRGTEDRKWTRMGQSECLGSGRFVRF